MGELEEIQKDLIKAIDDLEQKAQKGTGLLKEADCMWSCMEDDYKKKLSDVKERVELLECQVRHINSTYIISRQCRITQVCNKNAVWMFSTDIYVFRYSGNSKNTQIIPKHQVILQKAKF